MKTSCFIVDSCEIQQLEHENKMIHSSPINLVQVETLPYVSNLNVVVNLHDLIINDVVVIELQLFTDKDEIIAFTDSNKIIATKNELKTYCTLQTVHCKEGEFKIILFCNSEPVFEYKYFVECIDKEIYFDEITLV